MAIRSFGNHATRKFAKGDRRHRALSLAAKGDSIFYLEELLVWLNAVSATTHRAVSATCSAARNPLQAHQNLSPPPVPGQALRPQPRDSTC